MLCSTFKQFILPKFIEIIWRVREDRLSSLQQTPLHVSIVYTYGRG